MIKEKYVKVPSCDPEMELGGILQRDGTFDVVFVKKGTYYWRRGLKIPLDRMLKFARMVLAIAEHQKVTQIVASTPEFEQEHTPVQWSTALGPPKAPPEPAPDDDDEDGFGED